MSAINSIPKTVVEYFASLVDQLDELNLNIASYRIYYILVESVFDENNQTITYDTVIRKTIVQLNAQDYQNIGKSISQCGICKYNLQNILNKSVFVKVPTSDFYHNNENDPNNANNTDFFLYPLDAFSKDEIGIVKIQPVCN